MEGISRELMPKSVACLRHAIIYGSLHVCIRKLRVAHACGWIPEEFGVADAFARGVFEILVRNPSEIIHLEEQVTLQRAQDSEHTGWLSFTPVESLHVLRGQGGVMFADQLAERLVADCAQQVAMQLDFWQAPEEPPLARCKDLAHRWNAGRESQ